jgi:hypothetical protein
MILNYQVLGYSPFACLCVGATPSGCLKRAGTRACPYDEYDEYELCLGKW